jgi:predicted RNA binding protein YcfA (HicA-like mRNA interferase family)
MKVRDVIKRLTTEGWVLVRQKGSHQQYTHPAKLGKRVTLAFHSTNDDIPPGTLKSISRQAGWE